jgi:hypothetical protein
MTDTNSQGPSLNDTLQELLQSIDALREQGSAARREANESLDGIQAATQTIANRSLFSIGGIIERILDGVLGGFIELQSSYSQTNTLLYDSQDLLSKIDEGIGTSRFALKSTYDLLQQGFKRDSLALRNTLFNEEIGLGQGKQLIDLVGNLVEAGVSQKDISNIAEGIADIVGNTTRTASAAVAALAAQEDLQTAFGAMGLADEVAQATLNIGKRLGLQSDKQFLTLGQTIAELYDPKEIGAQAFLGVLGQKGLFSKDIDVLENALFDAILQGGERQIGMYQRASDTGNVLAVQAYRELGGEVGDKMASMVLAFEDQGQGLFEGMEKSINATAKSNRDIFNTFRMLISEFQTTAGASMIQMMEDSDFYRAITSGDFVQGAKDLLQALTGGKDSQTGLIETLKGFGGSLETLGELIEGLRKSWIGELVAGKYIQPVGIISESEEKVLEKAKKSLREGNEYRKAISAELLTSAPVQRAIIEELTRKGEATQKTIMMKILKTLDTQLGVTQESLETPLKTDINETVQKLINGELEMTAGGRIVPGLEFREVDGGRLRGNL